MNTKFTSTLLILFLSVFAFFGTSAAYDLEIQVLDTAVELNELISGEAKSTSGCSVTCRQGSYACCTGKGDDSSCKCRGNKQDDSDCDDGGKHASSCTAPGKAVEVEQQQGLNGLF